MSVMFVHMSEDLIFKKVEGEKKFNFAVMNSIAETD